MHGTPFHHTHTHMHSCTRALVHLHPYALSTRPPRPLPTQEEYSAPTQRKDLDPGSGEWLLVAARKKGSDSLLLAACAKRTDVLQPTASDTDVHLCNGVYWYCRQGMSFGFSSHPSIRLGSADVREEEGHHRLSWHLSSSEGGWRAGEHRELMGRGGRDWEKIVLVHPGRACSSSAASQFFPGRQVKTKDEYKNQTFDAFPHDGGGSIQIVGKDLSMATVVAKESDGRWLVCTQVNGAPATSSVDADQLVGLGPGFPANVSLQESGLVSLPTKTLSTKFPLQAIQTLCLADNLLQDLPEDFASAFPELRRLDLSGNTFTKFPACLRGCAWLEEVLMLRNARLDESAWLQGLEAFINTPPSCLQAVRIDFASVAPATKALMLTLAKRTVERSEAMCIALGDSGLGDSEVRELAPLLIEACERRKWRGRWLAKGGRNHIKTLSVNGLCEHPLKLAESDRSCDGVCGACGEVGVGVERFVYDCVAGKGAGSSAGMVPAESSPQSARRDCPNCPDCFCPMIVSNEYDGPYANSGLYQCNDCGSSGAGERWLCARCSNDYCFACHKPSRPRVGARVRLSSDHIWFYNASQGPLRPGVVGTVVAEDNCSLEVRAPNGQQGWYAEGALDEVTEKEGNPGNAEFFVCYSCVEFLSGAGEHGCRLMDASGRRLEWRLERESGRVLLRVSDGYDELLAETPVHEILWDSTSRKMTVASANGTSDYQPEVMHPDSLNQLCTLVGKASLPSVKVSGFRRDTGTPVDTAAPPTAELAPFVDLRGNHFSTSAKHFRDLRERVAACGGSILLAANPATPVGSHRGAMGARSQRDAVGSSAGAVGKEAMDEDSSPMQQRVLEKEGGHVFRWEGTVQDGVENSCGKRFYEGGWTLETTWVDGKRVGKGTATWRDGGRVKETWKVEFKDDQIHGLAVGDLADGSRYEGAVKEMVFPPGFREVETAVLLCSVLL